MTIERHEVGPRMSQCVVHNDVIYLAGQVDRDASPTAEQQTKNILDLRRRAGLLHRDVLMRSTVDVACRRGGMLRLSQVEENHMRHRAS